MVVFEDGLPRKSEYRRFKLSQDRNDDFAAMHEVIGRRFRRLVESRGQPVTDEDGNRRRFAYPPNLVIIDGGRGQLHAALDAVADLPVDDVAFAGLAKRFEELHLPDRARPVILPRGSEALFLVQRIRDEAHRFAITYQRNRRSRTVVSELDGIPGVGPARRRALLERFGSARGVRAASVEQLTEAPGISRTLAAQIRDHLHGTEPA
jgi:excinuclease ABC subunit C